MSKVHRKEDTYAAWMKRAAAACGSTIKSNDEARSAFAAGHTPESFATVLRTRAGKPPVLPHVCTMTADALIAERKQNLITLSAGMGSAGKSFLEERNRAISAALDARVRAHETQQAYAAWERSPFRPGPDSVLIENFTPAPRLYTEDVRKGLEEFLRDCFTPSQYHDVRSLVQALDVVVKGWLAKVDV